ATIAAAVVLFDALDPPLDFTHAVEIRVQTRLVAGAKILAQTAHFTGDAVEDAAVRPLPRRPLGCRPAVAEQVFEGHPRIDRQRHRRRRRRPADRPRIHAGVVEAAGPGGVDVFDPELER